MVARLVLIGLAAVLLRAGYLWSYAVRLPFINTPVLDAAMYDAWARSLIEGRAFVTGPFYHAPGYAYFLAAVYAILGPVPARAVVVQAGLGVVTTLLTVLMARRLFGEREATLAGILMLGAGTVYFYESKLLVETLALALGTAAVYLALLADGEDRPAATAEEARSRARAAAEGRKPRPAPRGARVAAALSGLAAGLLAVTRPNLLLFPLVVFVVLAARAARRYRPWSTTLLFGVGVAAALLPTTIHNASRGALAPVATNGGLNFYSGNFRGARGVYEDPPGFSGVITWQEAEADSLVKAELGHGLPPGAESSWWFAKGLREITADPGAWLALEGRKAWLLVNRVEEEPNGSLGLERDRLPFLRLAALPFNFFAAAGLIGLVLAVGAFRTRRGASALLVAPVAMLVAVCTTGLLYFVMARLRLAAVPVLAVLSAHALTRADEAWRAGRRIVVVGVVAAGAAFMALSWLSPLGPARNARWEARLFVESGRALEAKDRDGEAESAFREAMAIDPANVTALMHLGQLALKSHDLAPAIHFFEEARKSAPGDFGVRNNLGILYYEAQRYDDCDREMAAASDIHADLAGPYYYRGRVARQKKDPAAAEKWFQEAIQRDPRFKGAYALLVESLLDRGAVAEARQWADRAADRAVALPSPLAERLRKSEGGE